MSYLSQMKMSAFAIITSAKYLVVKEVKSRGEQNEKGHYQDEQKGIKKA